MQQYSTPKNLSDMSGSDLLKYVQGLGNSGSYSEGIAGNYAAAMEDLKNQVKTGKLTMAQYSDLMGPLQQRALSDWQWGSSQGSKSASAWNSGMASTLQGFYKQDPATGKYQAISGFTPTEYKNLPNNVLPTQGDINNGLIAPGYTPTQNVQQPQQNPSQPAAPGTPQSGSNSPAGTGPSLGFTSSPAIQDVNQILNLGQSQYDQSLQQSQQNTNTRSGMLNDLSSLLQKQQAAQLSQQLPGIYEDLNSRGLLRSSALGNELATQQSNMATNTSNALALQALQNQGATIGEQNQALQNLQSNQGSALSRGFSLEDFSRNVQAGINQGIQTQPSLSTPSKGTQYTSIAAPVVGQVAGGAMKAGASKGAA